MSTARRLLMESPWLSSSLDTQDASSVTRPPVQINLGKSRERLRWQLSPSSLSMSHSMWLTWLPLLWVRVSIHSAFSCRPRWVRVWWCSSSRPICQRLTIWRPRLNPDSRPSTPISRIRHPSSELIWSYTFTNHSMLKKKSTRMVNWRSRSKHKLEVLPV